MNDVTKTLSYEARRRWVPCMTAVVHVSPLCTLNILKRNGWKPCKRNLDNFVINNVRNKDFRKAQLKRNLLTFLDWRFIPSSLENSTTFLRNHSFRVLSIKTEGPSSNAFTFPANLTNYLQINFTKTWIIWEFKLISERKKKRRQKIQTDIFSPRSFLTGYIFYPSLLQAEIASEF